MSNRVCVFVDGESFRHTIVELFADFDRRDYLPKQAQWRDFFDWLVAEHTTDGTRFRTYWYLIEFLDFFPYKFPDAERETENLKAVLSKHAPLGRELSGLSEGALIEQMKQEVAELKSRREKLQKRFDGWRTLQDGIARSHGAIEFRRSGGMFCNLFDSAFGQEKTVDVKLATDLIMLRDIYDTAVIVSGDQDYVPAVQAVKDSGKIVANVGFLTRSGKLLPGGARRLNVAVDWDVEVSFEAFRRYLGLDTTPEPASGAPTVEPSYTTEPEGF